MATSESFTQLVTLTAAALLTDDVIPIVDIHDTTQGPTGSTKKITVASLFNAPTVASNLTVGGTLTVTGITTLSANALVAGIVKSGKSGSGTGGNFRAIDDTGTERWLMGLSGAASTKTFIVFDVVNGITRFSINETTGLITIADGVAITGNSSVAGTLSVTALAGTIQTAAQPNITSVGTLTSLALSGAITGVTTLSASGGVSVMNLTTSAGATIGTVIGVGGAPVSGATSTFIQGTNAVGVRIQRAQSDGDVVLQWSDNVSNSAMITMAAGQSNLTMNRGLTISSVGLTISAGGMTATGNSTITGTLSGITTLTATTIAGTLSTASQPNITSVGTLSNLVVSGSLTSTGAFLLGSGSTGSLTDASSNRLLTFNATNVNFGDVDNAHTGSLNFYTSGSSRWTIGSTGNLAASGAFSITTTGSLVISGASTFTTLTATKLKGGSGTPSVTAGSAAGSGATVSITGTDTAGAIVLNTGTGTTVGNLVNVTFSTAYTTAPYVAVNYITATGGPNWPILAVTYGPTTSFSIAAQSGVLTASGTYQFTYIVVG